MLQDVRLKKGPVAATQGNVPLFDATGRDRRTVKASGVEYQIAPSTGSRIHGGNLVPSPLEAYGAVCESWDDLRKR